MRARILLLHGLLVALLTLLARTGAPWLGAAAASCAIGLAICGRAPQGGLAAAAALLPVAIGAVAIADFAPAPAPRDLPAAAGAIALVQLSALIALQGFARRFAVARLGARLALALIAACTALAAGNVVLARAMPPTNFYDIPALPESPSTELFRLAQNVPDQELKWVYTPGYRGVFSHPQYPKERFSVNSDGFRGPEWPAELADDEQRILVLGDSQTVGLGVKYEETYAAVLERLLGQDEKRGQRVSVFNAGVAGYGPGEQLVMLPALLDRLRPTAVIGFFYDGNDLEDMRALFQWSRSKGRHSAVLESEQLARKGKLVTPGMPQGQSQRPPGLFDPDYWRTCRAGAIVCERVEQILLRARWLPPKAVYNNFLLRSLRVDVRDLEVEEDFVLTRDAFRAMSGLCTAQGIRFAVVRCPAKIQTCALSFERMLRDLGVTQLASYDRQQPGQRLFQALAESGIEAVDTLARLEIPDEDAPGFYFPEGHLDRRGHRALAEALLPLFAAR